MNLNGLTRRRSIGLWASLVFIVVYLGGCVVLLITAIVPAVNGTSNLKIGADSATYWSFVDILQNGGAAAAGIAFVSFGGNLLGPVLLGFILKSAVAVACFNLVMLGISLWAVDVVPGIKRLTLLWLLFLNGETAVSLITLNKEIFAITSLALIARFIYQQRPSYLILLLSLTCGLLARWEQTAILLLYVLLRHRGASTKRGKRQSLVILILTLSAIYPILLSSKSVDLQSFEDWGGSEGTIATLNAIQNHYGFILTLPFKIPMILFGALMKPWYFASNYLQEDFSDLQNTIFIHLHEAAMLGLWAVLLIKKRFTLDKPLLFLGALYLIITSINPFIQPRYEYPLYFLIAVELSRAPGSTEHVVRRPVGAGWARRFTWLPYHLRWSLWS